MAETQLVETKRLFDPMTGQDDPNEDTVLAAEYVMHLQDENVRRAFEVRLRDEPQLRDLVHEWEKRLAQLADEVAPINPPAHLKTAIEQAIAPAPVRAKRWPWLIALGAAALAAFVFLGPALRGPEALTPSFQAELSSSSGDLVITAGVIPATHEIVIDQLVGGAPEGRVLQLWLIAEGASVPVSLGLLNAEGATRVRVPDDIAPDVRTGTLAVSEEPMGGAPNGVPTGAVLATGTFVDL